jgi:hypothetical protein
LWHAEQFRLEECLNVHLDPGLWQFWHAPALCPPGRLWQAAQLDALPGWENFQLLPTEWQVVQEPLR